MITVPSVGSMLAVIAVALLVTAVLSAIVGVATHGGHARSAARPTGGTRVPEAPAPTPAPAVPGPRTRETAGV